MLDWSRSRTWMLAGLAVLIFNAVILGYTGEEDAAGGRLLGAVGGLLFLIGALTWAVRRGIAKSGLE